MDELAKIRQQIIDIVLEHEDELLAVQERIQTITDASITQFDEAIRKLESEFATRADASSGEFMKEYRKIEDVVRGETQAQLDAILAEIKLAQLKAGQKDS